MTLGGRAFWLACGAAYVLMAVAYWPTTQLAPIALDDVSSLEQLSQASFGQIFDYDRFGHLRPVKSALFWLLSRHPEWLSAWRVLALGCVLAAAGLGQVLCARLSLGRGWGLAVAVVWVANPITASVLCWLSTANLAICLLGILAYLHFAERSVSAAALCLLVAVFSHELGVVAPVLWLAYHGSANRKLLLASGLCIAAWALLLLTHDAPASQYRASGPLALHAPWFLFENLRLWFWLRGRFGVLLAEPAVSPWIVALCWIALIAALALWWRVRGRDPALDFAVCWCACLLLPLMNFVPLGNTPVALHYLFLPGFGLALALARAAQRLGTALPALALGLLIIAWLPEQRRTLAAWSGAEALYTASHSNYPENVEVRVNLIASYLDQKKYSQARALLLESRQLAPQDAALILNQFKLLAETGEAEAALALLPELVGKLSPDERFHAAYRVAIELVQAQQYARAKALVDRLLLEFPDRPELLLSKRLLAGAR